MTVPLVKLFVYMLPSFQTRDECWASVHVSCVDGDTTETSCRAF